MVVGHLVPLQSYGVVPVIAVDDRDPLQSRDHLRKSNLFNFEVLVKDLLLHSGSHVKLPCFKFSVFI